MHNIKDKFLKLFLIIKYYLVLFYVKLFRIKNDDIWLISERGDEARDNGYAFYKYLTKNHKEINVKYVITKNSQDRDKILEKDIVTYRSIRHYIYYISARYLLSTHISGTSPDFRSFKKLDRKNLLFNKGKQIFLQHGITKDYIPLMNKDNNPNLSIFICGGRREYEYILGKYGYSKNEAKYTGFARFDYLNNASKNQILVMPTWRYWYSKMSENEFLGTPFYNRYNELLNNKQLIEYLEKNNCQLIFYPHYEVQKFLHLFNTNSKMVKLATMREYDVQTLLKESNLLVTDYSSVYFDFAYMNKPIIYYQFDYEEYRNKHYAEGYFNYMKDGFGSVIQNEKELINRIIEIADNNFTNESKYENRVDDFFEKRDCKNCERIYNEIIKL